MTRPFRPRELLMLPVSSGAAVANRTLFVTVRRLVLGRRITMCLGADDGDLTMTVFQFDSRLDVRALAVGQLTDLTVTAEDIDWRTSRFERAVIVLHNDHIKAGAPPVLVAAPVDLTLDVPEAALDDLFRAAAPRLWARQLGVGTKRMRLPARTPEYPVQLPDMAHGLQLTAVTFAPGVVHVSGTLPEWRTELPPKLRAR